MSDPETVRVLEEVRALLSDEKRWTQHAWARTPSGYEVYPLNPQASCWCLLGAIERVTGEQPKFEATDCVLLPLWEEMMRRHPDATDTETLTAFNDDYARHADVLKLLDDTIARLRSAG